MKEEQELFNEQPPAEEKQESALPVVYQEQQEEVQKEEMQDATYEVVDDTKTEEPVFEMLDSPIDEKAKLDLGRRLAQITQAIKGLEDDKKEYDKDINNRIKEQQAIAEDIAREFLFGFTKQSVECFWIVDDPEPGVKSLYRKDNGQFVKKISMDLFDSKKESKVEEVPEVDLSTLEPTETVLENAQEAPQSIPEDELKELVRSGLEKGYDCKCANCGAIYKATAEDLKEYYTNKDYKFVCPKCYQERNKVMIKCSNCGNDYPATEEDLALMNDPAYVFNPDHFICPDCRAAEEAALENMEEDGEIQGFDEEQADMEERLSQQITGPGF